MEEQKNTSPHILNAASNLFGICFIVLTSLKVLELQGQTVVDEFTIAAMFLFLISAILSFLALRIRGKVEKPLENIADICFLLGLCCLFGTTILITFNVIK